MTASASEKEVAFRKRRRDYTINKPKHPVRAVTTVIRIKEPHFLRAETILASARAVKADLRQFEINSKRKESVNFPQPPADTRIVLAVRLSQQKDFLSPQSRGVLSELKLINQFDGVFVGLTEENRQKLRSVSHLIAYGVPSPEVVRQLIHTRARTIADGNEVLITGNKIIRDALGDLDVESLSDLVHVINSGGEAVSRICEFLAPFHFNPKEIQNAKKPRYSGGPSGWREDFTAFVESIL
jgi:60S ribosomal protein uL30